MIDTEQFSQCFSNWVADLSSLPEEDIIAIDGKCLRRSIDKASNKAAIYMVSAWSRQNSLVLGQVKVDDKSNEITAIPELLTRLDIAGAVITIDAMGCQKKIVEQIVQQKRDYVLSLKGNHRLLHEDVTIYFESPLSPAVAMQTIDGDHGRIETRTLRVSGELDWLEKEHSWTGLKSILAVTAKREVGEKVAEETRYFISSLSADDPGKIIRPLQLSGQENVWQYRDYFTRTAPEEG